MIIIDPYKHRNINLKNGLLAYWKCDETSGTTANDALGVNNGTLSNVTVNQTGKVDKAWDYNNANAYMLVNDAASLHPSGTEFTINMWLYIHTLPTTLAKDCFLTNYQYTITNNLWDMRFRNATGNVIRCRVGNSSGTNFDVISNQNVLAINGWHMFTYIHYGANYSGRIYIDGSDVTATTATFTGTLRVPDYRLTFGNSDVGGAYPIDGLMDEIGYWGRAINSFELAALAAGNTPYN